MDKYNALVVIMRLIDEVISACDLAIEKNIWDYRKNSFRDD